MRVWAAPSRAWAAPRDDGPAAGDTRGGVVRYAPQASVSERSKKRSVFLLCDAGESCVHVVQCGGVHAPSQLISQVVDLEPSIDRVDELMAEGKRCRA